jgi:hypothetical protein
MEEDIKVNFSKPMLVLKIRDVYKAPYHKNKYVILKKKDCLSLKDFKKKMHEYTGNWSSGVYDIQFVLKEGTYFQPTIYSTLARIEVRNGKVAKLWKTSPFSKTEYPIWRLFKEGKKLRKQEKKPIKKKTTKKQTKKKQKTQAKKKKIKKKQQKKKKTK